MERKDFLSKFIVGGSILLASPMIISSCGGSEDDVTDGAGGTTGDITIDLSSSSYSALGSVGGYAYKDNIIIIRTGESQYIALSKLCTHQNCTVKYDSSGNQLQCPCHGSLFSTSGAVTNGPASSPLKKYTVTLSGNTLTIK